MELSEINILITGATGFVGGRLAEYLALSDVQVKVRCLVHNPSSAVKLARLPIELVYGDMTSLDLMRKIVHGSDVIVHCAIGTYYDTVKGTTNILRAASECNVKKFVHISTVAVYGYSPNREVVEKSENLFDLYHTGDEYCDSKLDSEKIVFYYSSTKNLPVIVLRPTNIFGPYSKPWTIRPINMLKQRCYCLIDEGNSPSNIVYIDNVIYAILLAIKEDKAIGQTFIISDNRLVTWRDFFSAYAKMFSDPPPLLSIPSNQIEIERKKQLSSICKEILFHSKKLPLYLPILAAENKAINTLLSFTNKPSLKTNLLNLASHLPYGIKSHYLSSVSGDTPILSKIPNKNLAKIFTSQVQFKSKKATKCLGYRPITSFEKGMELTEKWLRYYRLIS